MHRTTSHRCPPRRSRLVALRWAALVMALGVVTLGSWPVLSAGADDARPGTTPASPATGNPERTSGSFPRFGKVTVTGAFSVDGAGTNVDTIAFWRAPKASRSLMFVSSKSRSLVEVWRYPFSSASSERAALRHRCLRATDSSATNGLVVDQKSDTLYVASNHSPNVCVFSLPDLAYRRTITSGTAYGQEPNLALLKLRTGSKRLYVSDDSVVHVHNARTGRKLSTFRPSRQLETMWADAGRQVLYIPDEGDRTGIYAYRPDGRPYEWNGRSKFGDSTIFDADAEGIKGYTCPSTRKGQLGEGLIVVSDQIDSTTVGNDYEVFDRRTWRHLGKIKLRLPDGSGYVHNTDGIGSIRQSSPQYSKGLFAVINDDQSVVGVEWRTVMRAISARIGEPFGCRR